MLALRYCTFTVEFIRFLLDYAELHLLLLQMPFSFSITLKRCISVLKFAGNVALELDVLYKPYSPAAGMCCEPIALLSILFIAFVALILSTCNKSSYFYFTCLLSAASVFVVNID